MCYHFTIEEYNEKIPQIKRFRELIQKEYPNFEFKNKTDFFPKDQVPVLIKGNTKANISIFKWGFETEFSKKVICNARSESVLEKKMFQEFIKKSRCVVLASGFYEYGKDHHTEYFFQPPNNTVLYMAGFYNEKKNTFTLLTTEANKKQRDIHDRMPLILKEEEILEYLKNDAIIQSFLNKELPELIFNEVNKIE